MSENITVNDTEKTSRFWKVNLKKVAKYSALAVFGTAVGLVVLDKATNRSSKNSQSETDETLES